MEIRKRRTILIEIDNLKAYAYMVQNKSFFKPQKLLKNGTVSSDDIHYQFTIIYASPGEVMLNLVLLQKSRGSQYSPFPL